MRISLYCIVILLLFEVISADLQQDITIFDAWLDARNPFPNKKFSLQAVSNEDEGYLGNIKLIATDDIPVGEVVYKFPISLYFDSPLIGKEVGEGRDAHKLLYSHATFIHLIHERDNKESDWFPYLNIVPNSFYTPLFWTHNELEELRGTSVYGSVRRQNGSLVEEYEEVFEDLDMSQLYPDIDLTTVGEVYSLDAWKWAYSLYRSRSWKERERSVILPVVELFNYANRANVAIEVKDGVIEFTSNVKIAKGEKIFINDGLVGNKELLEWYGFVVPSNPHDYYPVGVGLDESDRLYGFKKTLFKEAEIKDGATYHLTRNHVPPKMLLALRIYHVSIYDHSEAREAFAGKQISSQNELSVCQTVIELCESTIERMPHTLKADGELLKSADLPRNLHSAIIIRKAEKAILRSVLKMAKMQLQDVQSGWDLRSFDIPTIKQ